MLRYRAFSGTMGAIARSWMMMYFLNCAVTASSSSRILTGSSHGSTSPRLMRSSSSMRSSANSSRKTSRSSLSWRASAASLPSCSTPGNLTMAANAFCFSLSLRSSSFWASRSSRSRLRSSSRPFSQSLRAFSRSAVICCLSRWRSSTFSSRVSFQPP